MTCRIASFVLMAESISAKQLDDITECPICTEIFNDPRVLPCVHTFCLKCIEKWAQNMKLEDKLSCPMCRNKLHIDRSRVSELPKNFFVEKLLEVRKMASMLVMIDTPCDLCFDGISDERSGEGKKLAELHCVECRQNMCRSCSVIHRNTTVCKQHRMVDLSNESKTAGDLLLNLLNRCDKHPEDTLRMYCLECNTVACVMCYVASHNSHRCADISQVAEDMNQEIRNTIDTLNRQVTECMDVLKKLENHEQILNESAADARKQIIGKSEEIKRQVENYKLELLEQLSSVKKKQDKQIETLKHEVERRMLMLQSFMKYSEELVSKGTACDVARAASCLRERAKELTEFNVERDLDIEGSGGRVRFMSDSKKSLVTEVQLIYGHVTAPDSSTIEGTLVQSSKPVFILHAKASVTGVTSLGDNLFVCHHENQRVDVYDTTSFTLQRQISLPNKGEYRGIAACGTNSCLYLTERTTNRIFRIELPSNAATNWSVGIGPLGLSISTDKNVLVACNAEDKIQEYTTHGTLVREITLQSDITNPLNVVQLSNDQFGVTHQGSLHRYCVVGLDGQAIKSYGSSPGSGVGQLNNPCGLSVSKRGTVFIADSVNNRVLMLDPATFTASQLSVDGGLTYPYRLHIDTSQGRLYVGEWGGRRLVALGK